MKEKEKKLSKEDTTKNVDKIEKKRKQEQVEKKEKHKKKKDDNTYREKVTDKITLKTHKEQYKHTKSINENENEKCQSDPSKDKDSSVVSSNLDSTSFNFIKQLIERRIPNVARDLSTRLSIAIPSTVINHKNDVVKAYITSYLARICTIFSIDKIYIYDDQFRYEQEAKPLQNENDGSWNNQTRIENVSKKPSENRNEEENKKKEKRTYNNNNNSNNNNEYSYLCRFMHCNLQYLETPQYLRKHLFPITPFLKNTGIMNPVDAPHHLRSDEWLPFREGVLIEKKENGVIIDVGLFSNVFVKNENIGARERDLDIGTRVTVLFDETAYHVFQKKKKQKDILFTGKLISPRMPLLYNVYWGYTIEVLKNVSDIFQLKFDYLVGTSERGTIINGSCVFEKGKSILIVFGNKNGLEELLIREKEEKVKKHFSVEDRQIALNKILKKFHFFINICAFQTSRTIRTEEALTITLSLIHNILK